MKMFHKKAEIGKFAALVGLLMFLCLPSFAEEEDPFDGPSTKDKPTNVTFPAGPTDAAKLTPALPAKTEGDRELNSEQKQPGAQGARPPENPQILLKQRETQFRENLENTIQKVGAKTDRPQDKDANGNLLSAEDLRHKDELKPEWELDLAGEKVTKAQQQALQAVGGTIEMPGARKAAAEQSAKEAEKKLATVVRSLESGGLSPEDTKRVELLIESYNRNPNESNANQIISQVVSIGDKVASNTPASAIEKSPEIYRPTPANPDSQFVIETKPGVVTASPDSSFGQETFRRMKEISSLLKSDKKTITPAALAAKELTSAKPSPIVRTKTNGASFDVTQPKPSPVAFIQSTAKAWVSKLLQALTKKPAERRDVASIPDSGADRETASTPELRVDSQIQSVEGSIGPLTAAIVNPEPTSDPLIPSSLLFGLGLLLTAGLLVLSKVRR